MPETPNLPVVVIACKVFENFIEKYIPKESIQDWIFLDYGLHRVPKNLKIALQEQLDQIINPSLVVLGYGLCGNGLDGIQAGIHTLLIPRTDDCIAILLGSYQAYQHEFSTIPGTYYLTKGWLESGSNPLQEFQEYKERYGEEKAIWLMDTQYHNYKRVAFVAHEEADLTRYRKVAQEVAQFCGRWGMVYQELVGSDRYIRRLAEAIASLQNIDEDFIVIEPGGELKQRNFIHL